MAAVGSGDRNRGDTMQGGVLGKTRDNWAIGGPDFPSWLGSEAALIQLLHRGPGAANAAFMPLSPKKEAVPCLWHTYPKSVSE